MFIRFVSDSLASPSLKEIKDILFTEVSQSVILIQKCCKIFLINKYYGFTLVTITVVNILRYYNNGAISSRPQKDKL